MLFRMAQVIREHSDELATIETRDTGKPLRQSRSDVAAAARYCPSAALTSSFIR